MPKENNMNFSCTEIEEKIKDIMLPIFEKYLIVNQAWTYLIFNSEYDNECFDIYGDFGINGKHWEELCDDMVNDTLSCLDELKHKIKHNKNFNPIKQECNNKLKDLKDLICSCKDEYELDICNKFWKTAGKALNTLTPPCKHVVCLKLEVKRNEDDIVVKLIE